MCCTKSTAHLHSKYLPFTINNLNNKIIMPRNCWKQYVHALSVNQRVPVRVNMAILLTECHMISYHAWILKWFLKAWWPVLSVALCQYRSFPGQFFSSMVNSNMNINMYRSRGGVARGRSPPPFSKTSH